jgi:hypothetical protein
MSEQIQGRRWFGVDFLRERLEYCPVVGVFRWKIVRPGRKIGSVAGCQCKISGYRNIKLLGVGYSEHHLAWLYMTGKWPTKEVDHKDTNRSNNAWSNLREATHGQNQSNCRAYKNNKLGYKGVSIVPTRPGKYRARIRNGGVEKSLGVYNTPQEAQAAYVVAAKELHGKFWRI